jgi:hypothetical protein
MEEINSNNKADSESTDPILSWIAKSIEAYDALEWDSEGVSVFLKGELIAKFYYEDLADVLDGDPYDEE